MRRHIAILASLCLALSITACSKTDDFDKRISELAKTSSSKYISIENMDELIEKAKPNLIVRGKVVSHGESTIVDYSGEYTDAFLASDATEEEKQQCAAAFLSTPYEIDVSETFLGDEVESFTINMPYGIYDEYWRRDGDYPVLKVGTEYLLFMRVDVMFGQKVYYLAFAPASAVEVDRDDLITDGERAGLIFGDSYDELTAELQAYIAENSPDTSMDVFG